MTPRAEIRETGFDHCLDSQDLFRRLLRATARPGTLVDLRPLSLTVPPGPLRPACALLLAVLDLEVSFHVVGPEAAWLTEYLCLNTGAWEAPIENADFILVTAPTAGDAIGRVRCGTLTAPHRGATVIYTPMSLTPPTDPGTLVLSLQGPGIAREARLPVRGILAGEWERLRALMDFPLGVDIWLAARDGDLAVIPRSTRFRVEG